MERVAIIGGARTPFVKAAGAFSKVGLVDLGTVAVKGAIDNSEILPAAIEELAFGTVLLDPRAPNWAREIVFRASLPKTINAHSVSNNCISGLVAAGVIADGIKSGRISLGLAGGVESMSRPTLTLPRRGEEFFYRLSRVRSLGEKLSLLSGFRPGMVMPLPPSPKEPSTGLTMGQHCEQMAKEFGIGRKEQDELAFRSHKAASQAQLNGFLAKDIIETLGVKKDGLVRAETTLEKLAKLNPVFDRSPAGTITAGNASALTDGASAVVLMSESRAKKEGKQILGYIEAIEYAAIDPKDGLLMAPALAVPQLLKKANLGISDIDWFEIHEAFAAQVLCNLQAWEKGWSKYASAAAIGKIPNEKINPNGGSLALGHPFAATGGRLLLAASRHLQATKTKKAVISVCAAGAMAAAVLVSAE